MAYGKRAQRKNRWYSGFKLAARGLGAYGAYTSGIGSTKYGWKKGGKVFKSMFGRRKGMSMGRSNTFSRLGSNRGMYVRRTGSNPGKRTGSNPGNRTGSNPTPGKAKKRVSFLGVPRNYNPGRKASKRRY